MMEGNGNFSPLSLGFLFFAGTAHVLSLKFPLPLSKGFLSLDCLDYPRFLVILFTSLSSLFERVSSLDITYLILPFSMSIKAGIVMSKAL